MNATTLDIISYSFRQDQNPNLVPHIGNLVVADGFRRQGVGLGLMTVACQTAKSWGYPAVYCGECVYKRLATHAQLYMLV